MENFKKLFFFLDKPIFNLILGQDNIKKVAHTADLFPQKSQQGIWTIIKATVPLGTKKGGFYA